VLCDEQVKVYRFVASVCVSGRMVIRPSRVVQHDTG
jgi:hypothetical protein